MGARPVTFSSPEIDLDDPHGLGPMANVLDHPLGAWTVTQVTLLVCNDPESGGLTGEQLVEDIEDGLRARHDNDFVAVHVKDEESIGYVLPNWPAHGHHGDYSCDCGPDLQDDWPDRVRPLVPSGLLVLLDRVRDHLRGDASPETRAEMETALLDAERSLAPSEKEKV